jgi:hypothetical protein
LAASILPHIPALPEAARQEPAEESIVSLKIINQHE